MMAKRITDLIEFIIHYILFSTAKNLNMCKKVLTCLFICKLKNRFIFTEKTTIYFPLTQMMF